MEKIEAQITNMEEEEAAMTTTITFILPVIATGVEKTAATKKTLGAVDVEEEIKHRKNEDVEAMLTMTAEEEEVKAEGGARGAGNGGGGNGRGR